MSNPWLKKNPFMSMWLSAANRAAGPLRGQVTAQARRTGNAVATQMARESIAVWTAAITPARAKRKAKRKR